MTPTRETEAAPIPATPMRSRKAAGVAMLGLLGFAAAAAGVTTAAASHLPDPTRLAPGIRVAEVEVGGLTREEATERLREWARQQVQVTITLTGKERKWSFALSQWGGRFDLPAAVAQAWQAGQDENLLEKLYYGSRARDIQIDPPFKIDSRQVETALKRIAAEIDRPAKNARAKMDARGNLLLAAREEKGLKLDLGATSALLLKGGADALRGGGVSELVVAEQSPTVTAADLGKMGQLLGAFGTYYGSSPENRKSNVALAASKINGTLLGPGDVFSYNDIVGPRQASLGWKMAHQYQDGLVVDGIGGGVCQVSSTLYNVVLLSDLKVVQRSNHSMPVAYLHAGRDATVSYDAVDFKFANNTGGPIFVAASADGSRLLFRIFGANKSARQVRDIIASGRTYNARGGFTVTTWREVRDADGKTTRERISTDYYRPPKDTTPPRPRVARRRPRIVAPIAGTPPATAPVAPSALETPGAGATAERS